MYTLGVHIQDATLSHAAAILNVTRSTLGHFCVTTYLRLAGGRLDHRRLQREVSVEVRDPAGQVRLIEGDLLRAVDLHTLHGGNHPGLAAACLLTPKGGNKQVSINKERVKGYSADAKGYYSVDVQGCNADAKGYRVDITGYSADAKGYRVDVKGYSADAKGYSVDVTGYSADAKGYRVDVKGMVAITLASPPPLCSHPREAINKVDVQGCNADAKGYRVDVTGYSVDAKGYSVGVKGYSADAKGYRMDVKGYIADAKGYMVDIKGYIADAKGYRVDVKHYIADAKGYRVDVKGYIADAKGRVRIASSVATGLTLDSQQYYTSTFTVLSFMGPPVPITARVHALNTPETLTAGLTRAFQSVDVKGCNADAKGYRVDVKGWCTHRGHDASGHDISDRNALVNGNEAPPHWDPPPANARGVHHIHVQGALNIATCATVTRPMRARLIVAHSHDEQTLVQTASRTPVRPDSVVQRVPITEGESEHSRSGHQSQNGRENRHGFPVGLTGSVLGRYGAFEVGGGSSVQLLHHGDANLHMQSAHVTKRIAQVHKHRPCLLSLGRICGKSKHNNNDDV
eukprot:1183453-Prorocentrum_minimum.AAC.2